MNKKPIYSTHIGAASIMLIFMVLSLISFATLTLVNSRADYVLTKKMSDRSDAYYNACHEANAFVAQTDAYLQNVYKNASSKEDYLAALDGQSFNKSIPLGDIQTLEVAIEPKYPNEYDRTTYTITSWKVVTHDDRIELDESLPVMK